MNLPMPLVRSFDLLPQNAPFSPEQRQWLSGFFAGYLKLDTTSVTALSSSEASAIMSNAAGIAEDEEAPWHDPAMAITERMALAAGKPLKRRMFAAMAQQNCGQCGYLCETYSTAITEGKEARLNLCAPGGKETLRMLRSLAEKLGTSAALPAIAAKPEGKPPLGKKGYSRDNPVDAVFLSRRKLNGDGSAKHTYHIEFDLSQSGITYAAGDSFGIFAANDPRLVDAVIALIGARPEHEINGKALRDILIHERALGPAPDALFQLISFVTGAATRFKAQALAKGEDPDGDLALLDVLGTLHKFAGLKLSPEAFIEALEVLQPRLYSISSSPRHHEERLTLTVDCVRYPLGRRERFGLASTFLGERIAPGERLPVYVQRAHGFALPENPNLPVIMVGPGTGIAPFRAFLQERAAIHAPGKNWLFFGHQHVATDFFYADELNAMLDKKLLTRLSLAWSRDGSEKIYVQDRMRDSGAELWAWLEQGAHFYVCGDAKRMAKDVERALVDIAMQNGDMPSDVAIAFVASLKKNGRYQADVYWMPATLHQPVKTTCPYCGVGCGVIATPDALDTVTIAGDPAHPANSGKLCVKGAALGETLGLDGRLLHPMIHGQRATWNQATGFVARSLQDIIDRHGPKSVAFYLSGQMLTEDYYIANKFAKGFLGTPHVDTNSRLCMASSVAGHRRAFGSDTVPNTYADLDGADLIILVGSNAAWCHPVLYQRMQAAREKRGAVIVNIDPRRTATSEGSDLQLSVRPGMDSVLFSWLLVQLAAQGVLDQDYLDHHTNGFDAALASAQRIAPDIETVAAKTGLDEADITRFVALFANHPRVVTCYSQGVNQSAQGSDKVNAILNCHLATGRIGKPGSGPLSLTGQPNAMGGREVGGLANMLAAHMGYSPVERERVARFWNAPNLAESEGLKAIQMFEAIERGEIKALWVMHTNPAVTLPRADAMRAAMKKLELFVVSEALTHTDTTLAGAHVLLPATAWGEKGGTVTNSERRISRQRAFLPAPGEAKPDWEHIALVARRMGFEKAFAYANVAEIYREHAALSGFENGGSRDFDISATAGFDTVAYDALQPFQWPWRKGEKPQARFFADGQFYTPDKRANLIAIADPMLAAQTDASFSFLLNTGRVRDHWHTMTRTGKSIRLARHIAEPTLAIHPADAAGIGVIAEAFVRIESLHGAATLKTELDPGLPRGSVFAPFHWNDATSGLARLDAVAQALSDPVSGQPEFKATPVRVVPVIMASEGFLISRQRITLPDWLQHTRITIPGGEALVFASTRLPEAIHALLINHLGEASSRTELFDADQQEFRTLAFEGDRLAAALSVHPARDSAALEWLIESFSKDALSPDERKALLAGMPPAGGADLGPLVCSCFGVRRASISAAIAGGAATVEAVGESLKAGTNCGSCRPEIKRVINDEQLSCAKSAAA